MAHLRWVVILNGIQFLSEILSRKMGHTLCGIFDIVDLGPWREFFPPRLLIVLTVE